MHRRRCCYPHSMLQTRSVLPHNPVPTPNPSTAPGRSFLSLRSYEHCGDGTATHGQLHLSKPGTERANQISNLRGQEGFPGAAPTHPPEQGQEGKGMTVFFFWTGAHAQTMQSPRTMRTGAHAPNGRQPPTHPGTGPPALGVDALHLLPGRQGTALWFDPI